LSATVTLATALLLERCTNAPNHFCFSCISFRRNVIPTNSEADTSSSGRNPRSVDMRKADPSNRPNRPHISSDTQLSKNTGPKPKDQRPEETKSTVLRQTTRRDPIKPAPNFPRNQPPAPPATRPRNQQNVAAPSVKRCLVRASESRKRFFRPDRHFLENSYF
jgi:hypothetical protein